MYIFRPTIAIVAITPVIPTATYIIMGNISELSGGEGVGYVEYVGKGDTDGEGDDVVDGAGEGDIGD